MAIYSEEEDPSLISRPMSPERVTAGMSADEPALSPTATDFPKLSDPPPENVPAFSPLPKDYEAQQNSIAADQAAADRAAEAERKRAESTAKAVETKRLREQGVKLTVDAQNQPVPETRPDGTMVYEPAWTGSPAFDPEKKTWVREKRDETGKVTPVDLWDNGDISREPDTGELYFNQGGVRTVVGKDDGYLRKKAIAGEVRTLSEAAAQRNLEAAQARLDLNAIMEPAREKEKELKAAQQLLEGPKAIAAKNPDWLKNPRNAELLRSREESVANLSKDPLLSQHSALKQKQRELDEAEIADGKRRLALVTERNALDVARTRPELVGPAPARPGESPDVTADRQAHGIGGDAYQVPAAVREQSDFRQAMIHLDTLSEQLAPKGMVLGPDPERESKLADVNRQRGEVIKQFTGRIAAVNKYEAQDKALSLEIARHDWEIQGKSIQIDRQRSKLDTQLAAGQITPSAYDSAVIGMETDIQDLAKKRDAMSGVRRELKKQTFNALKTPSEFPATLITDGNDLDPRAVSVRAAGRAAAFGTSQAQELYDTLLEIKAGGKISKIGGIPIAAVIGDIGGQLGMKLQDILTSGETKSLQEGLRGGIFDQQLALLHQTRGTDEPPDSSIVAGTKDPLKPLTDGPRALPFWQDTVDQTEKEIAGQPVQPTQEQTRVAYLEGRKREDAAKPLITPEQADAMGWKGMSPDQKKSAIVGATIARDAVLRKWDDSITSTAERLGRQIESAKSSAMGAYSSMGEGLLETVTFAASLFGANPETFFTHKMAKTAKDYWGARVADEDRDAVATQIASGLASAHSFMALTAPIGVVAKATGAAEAVGGVAGKVIPALTRGKTAAQVAELGTTILGAGGVGALQQAGNSYGEAIDMGLTPEQARMRFVLNLPVGATEAVGIAGILGKLDRLSGGSLGKFLYELAKQGLEEGSQEFAQNVMSDVADLIIMKKGDPRRKEWDAIISDAQTAGQWAAVTGVLFAGLSMAAGRIDKNSQKKATTSKLEAAFGTLDTHFNALTEAVRSSEALAKFNSERERKWIDLKGGEDNGKTQQTEKGGRQEVLNSPDNSAGQTGGVSQSAPASAADAATALDAALVETDKAHWEAKKNGGQSDVWFDGANANAAARAGFDSAMQNGGSNLQAHGMAKEATLSGGLKNLANLLRNGLDMSRRGGQLDTAPLVAKAGQGLVGATASGAAYNDGPFMLIARPGQSLKGDLSGLGAVLVNEANANLVPQIRAALQAIRPGLIVESYANAGEVTKSLLSPSSPSQNQSSKPAGKTSTPVSTPATQNTGFVPLTMETANDLLNKTGRSRSMAALRLILNDDKKVEAAIAAIDPKADKAALAATIQNRPAVLAQVLAIGKDFAQLVAPGGAVEPGPLKNAIVGHMVLGKLDDVLRGGTVPKEIGQSLEAQGYLIQKPTEAGGTRWVLTAPGLELMDGDLRRTVAKNPKAFQVDLAANTEQPGKLTAEVKSEGDAAISQGLVKPGEYGKPGYTAIAPTGQQPVQQYEVKLEGPADANGFKTVRTVTVQVARPEDAGAAAVARAQANKWKGEWTAVEAKLSPDSAGQPAYSPANGQTGTQTGTGDTVGGGGSGVSDNGSDGGGSASNVDGQDSGGTGGNSGGAVETDIPGAAPADTGTPDQSSQKAEFPADAPAVGADGTGGIHGSGSGGTEAGGSVTFEQLAATWDHFPPDMEELKRKLQRAVLEYREDSTKPTGVYPSDDGKITLHIHPEDLSGPVRRRNAAVSEEVKHLGTMLAERDAWIAAGGKNGTKQTFNEFLHSRAKELFADVVQRTKALTPGEQAAIADALIGSYNTYFWPFAGFVEAKSVADVKRALDREGEPGHAPTYFGFIHELARQITQLRDEGSITEATQQGVLAKVIAYIERGVAALKAFGESVRSGALAGSKLDSLIARAEQELRWFHGEEDMPGDWGFYSPPLEKKDLRGSTLKATKFTGPALVEFMAGRSDANEVGDRPMTDTALERLARYFDGAGRTKDADRVRGELARRAMEKEESSNREDAEEDRWELRDAIRDIGGINIGGEHAFQLRQMHDQGDPKGKGKGRVAGVIKVNGGHPLDVVRNSLQSRGFNIKTESDLLDNIERMLAGERIIADPIDGRDLGRGEALNAQPKYNDRVEENLRAMGTPLAEWSVVPFTGNKAIDSESGRVMFEQDYTEVLKPGWKDAPTIYPPGSDNKGVCGLCGKSPIVNLFGVKNDSKKWKMMVGSECVARFSGVSGARQGQQESARLNIVKWQSFSDVLADAQRELKWKSNWSDYTIQALVDEAVKIIGKLDPKDSGDAAFTRWVNKNEESAQAIVQKLQDALEAGKKFRIRKRLEQIQHAHNEIQHGYRSGIIGDHRVYQLNDYELANRNQTIDRLKREIRSLANPDSKNSTQVNVAGPVADQVLAFGKSIPESELYTEKEGYGLETEPHVTVLYGIEATPSQVAYAASDVGPIVLELGKTSLFEPEGKPYDVLKIDINGPGIRQLNKALNDAHPVKSDFPDYKPHLTIAYLKKGAGAKYVGDSRFDGITVPADSLVFSGKDERRTILPLTAKPAAAKAPAPTGQMQLLAQPRTISQTGEGNLFGEKELPFNLQGEEDTTAVRQQIADQKQSAEEARRRAESEQTDLFAGARTFSNGQIVGPGNIPLLAQRAYHGTPHAVDRFSTEKIGTGEGAQAYGWGLYFAESKAVAENYRKQLDPGHYYDGQAFDPKNPAHMAAFELNRTKDRNVAISNFESFKGQRTEAYAPLADAAIEILKTNAEPRIEPSHGGNNYTVSLDVEPEELLDWDKPLSDQSEKVQLAVEKVLEEEGVDAVPGTQTGADAYQLVNRYLNGPDLTSNRFEIKGIPGIRYLDAGSRNRTRWTAKHPEGGENEFATEGEARAFVAKNPEYTLVSPGQTYNYVIFDESKIRILEENGKPVDGETRTALLAQPRIDPNQLGFGFDDVTGKVQQGMDFGSREVAKPQREDRKAESPANPTTHIAGDLAEYTGETREIAGGTFHVVKFLEGSKAGQEGVTQRAPDGTNPNIARAQEQWQREQAGFRKIREAQGITDFGQKIGGARKDTAIKTGPTGKKPVDDRPAWARRYQISQIIKSTDTEEESRWSISDLKNTDWRGNPRQIGDRTYATQEEAEAAIPLIAVSRNHDVRMEKVGPEVAPKVDAVAQVEADAKKIEEIRASEGGKLIYMLSTSDRIKKALELGTISQADYDRAAKLGSILSPEKEALARAAKAEIEKVQSAPWANSSDQEYKYTIWRKVSDSKRIQVVETEFPTREDALRYMATHAQEIIETKTVWREELFATPEKAVRTGKPRREGPANSKMFEDTFGFRGVEFGKWLRQEGDGKERQDVLNHAFDGLLDLADVLGIPPRAISLNGELALAFGARGQGLQGAKAHYERDYAVINLTKMSGAGSLAHEWFHGFDHYLGRLDGKAAAEMVTNLSGDRVFAAKGRDGDYVSHGFGYKSNVREAVREAYNAVLNTIAKKAVQYVEDSQKAEKFVKATRDNLAADIKTLRDDLTRNLDPTYYKRNNKPAPEEQIAEFDRLTNKLLDGQDLETEYRYNKTDGTNPRARGAMSGRWSNDTLDAIGAIYKAVRGRSGFNSEQTGRVDGIRRYLKNYAQRIAMLESAAASEEKTKFVPTDFAMNAKRIDQGSATDYWTTPHEMAARAFSAYVEDKVSDQGGKSDFLSYGSDNRLPKYRMFNLRPFPEGAEREAINKALDDLFNVLESVETDKGVALRAQPRVDQEYLAAVEKGDMETAQRMVDQAAKDSGFTRKVYHGTEDGGFVQFDPERTSKKTGFVYFSTGRGTAASYSGSRSDLPAGAEGRGIWTFYLKSPEWTFDFEQAGWDGNKPDGTVNEWHDFGGIDGIAQDAKDAGVSSFEVQNVLDEGPNGDSAWYDSTIGIADPSLIKSADPVTRDEDGNVIPLSKRFNPSTGNFLMVQPRAPQQWFGFGLDVSQADTYQLPLTVADGMRGATKDENALFHGNIGLAYKIAGSYGNLGDLADMRQEALIALTRAVKTFNPEKGKFSALAGTIIRNHLNALYRDRDKLHATSLDAELGDSGQTLEDVTAGQEESPAVSAQRREAVSAVQEVLAGLPPDLKAIMSARMAGQTQEEIGKSRGVSKQQISSMEKAAMGILKTRLKARGVDGIPLKAQPKFNRGQEDFIGKLDKQIFPSMIDAHHTAGRTSTQADAVGTAESLLRDVQTIADGIESVEPEELPEKKKTTLRDIYSRFFRGRFDKMDYFASGSGQVLLDGMRENGLFAAAFRRFNEGLEEKVKAAFGYPSYWRNRQALARLKRFKAEMLPFAALLNPTSRDDAGDLVFSDFWQRSGELSGKQLENMGRMPGDEWMDADGQVWQVGEFVVPDPKKPEEGFYQLLQFIPAASQEKIHSEFHGRFPEAAFLLDDFIEPGMEAERVVSPNGIELPTFNRHSLYGFYGDTPAGLVSKIPGYTPDVVRTKSLAGMAAHALKLNWQSPGRDYKSGQARVSGLTRDLFEGFNIRAAQAHAEKQRRDMAEKLLRSTMRPVPADGLPEDYQRIDRDTLNPLIRAFREASKRGQNDMPEILSDATDQLTRRNLETLEFLFGDAALFDPNQMIHKEVLAELNRGFVKTRLENDFLDGMMSWLRSNVAGVLADFQTLANNKIGNYIFHSLRILERTSYAAISAVAGDTREAKVAWRESQYLVRGFFTNFFHPVIRERMNRLVPPELFEDQNIVRQMMAENAGLTVAELLKQGNVGGAFLKGVGYAEMDTRAKQKLALASLLARASVEADDAGITEKTARRAWMEKWVENAPVDARREAEAAAKLYLMDYGNVPWWLDQGHQVKISGQDVTPIANFVRTMAIPFWKYPYNYLRQIKRTLVNPVYDLTVNRKNLTGQEKRQAMANIVAMGMLQALGWLMFKPWGDDKDEEILGRELDDLGEELDPKLRTGSRMRLSQSSAAGKIIGTAARMFGADTENDDLWVRMRTLPYATQGLAIGAAFRLLTNPNAGNAKTAWASASDMMEDFMSIGSGARLALSAMGYRDDYTKNQTTAFMLGQGAVNMLTARLLPPRALRDIANLVDGTNRRLTPAKSLGYEPGLIAGAISSVPGATKLLPPSGKVTTGSPSSPKTIAARTELESMGLGELAYREYLDADGKLKASYVKPEMIYKIPAWKALVRQLSFNIKPVPKQQYQEQLAGVE